MPILVLIQINELNDSEEIIGVFEYLKGGEAKEFAEKHAPDFQYQLKHMYMNDLHIIKRI